MKLISVNMWAEFGVASPIVVEELVKRSVRYSNGDMYEGSWNSEGKRHGIGRLVTSSGSEYHGEFVKGFFHGQGVLSFSDGSKFEGTFECGKYHGYGVYVDAQQMKYEVTVERPLVYSYNRS